MESIFEEAEVGYGRTYEDILRGLDEAQSHLHSVVEEQFSAPTPEVTAPVAPPQPLHPFGLPDIVWPDTQEPYTEEARIVEAQQLERQLVWFDETPLFKKSFSRFVGNFLKKRKTF